MYFRHTAGVTSTALVMVGAGEADAVTVDVTVGTGEGAAVASLPFPSSIPHPTAANGTHFFSRQLLDGFAAGGSGDGLKCVLMGPLLGWW